HCGDGCAGATRFDVDRLDRTQTIRRAMRRRQGPRFTWDVDTGAPQHGRPYRPSRGVAVLLGSLALLLGVLTMVSAIPERSIAGDAQARPPTATSTTP